MRRLRAGWIAVAACLIPGVTPGQAAEPPSAPAPAVSPADQLNQKQLDSLRAPVPGPPPQAVLGPPLMLQSVERIDLLR